MKKWYSLHTHPGTEQKVEQALSQYDVETFLPVVSCSEYNQKEERAPFFPGYLFIHIDLNVDEPICWTWITGVRYIVSYGDWPVPVPDEIIHLIQQQLTSIETKLTDSAHQFTPGDLVKIRNGPFKAMIGVFDGPVNPSARVNVILDGLCNTARLRIKRSELETISGSAELPTTRRPRRTRGRGRRIHY